MALYVSKADAERKTAEANLSAVLENAPDHVLLFDLDANIKYVNRTPYSAIEDIIGKPKYDLLPENSKDMPKKAIDFILKTGDTQQYNIEHPAPDDQTRIFESHIGTIKQSDEITGFVLITRDITDR